MLYLVYISCDHYKTFNMRQISNNKLLNSTCNHFLLLNATTSFLCLKLVILLIRSHLLLVITLVLSLDFTGNIIPTFQNHLVVVLPSSPPPIFAMLYALSALANMKMLSRSPKLFKISSTNLSLLKPL